MAQIIATADIRKSPRGRKMELRDDLVALFSALLPGQGILLDTEFPACGDDKVERAKVGQAIRKNFANCGRTDHAVPSVNFTAEGLAQVSIHEAKTKAAQDAAAAALVTAEAEVTPDAEPEVKSAPKPKVTSGGKRPAKAAAK